MRHKYNSQDCSLRKSAWSAGPRTPRVVGKRLRERSRNDCDKDIVCAIDINYFLLCILLRGAGRNQSLSSPHVYNTCRVSLYLGWCWSYAKRYNHSGRIYKNRLVFISIDKRFLYFRPGWYKAEGCTAEGGEIVFSRQKHIRGWSGGYLPYHPVAFATKSIPKKYYLARKAYWYGSIWGLFTVSLSDVYDK